MITNFENITEGLSTKENTIILPKLISLVKWRRGKKNAVSNKKLINLLSAMGHDISQPRMRKMINQIRLKKLVKNLIASSKGYYVTDDPAEIKNYILSLRERAEAINAVADSLLNK